MFITRASRHDKDDIKQFMREADWEEEPNLDRGTAFIARDGGVIGCVRLVDVAPQTLVVDDVIVKEDRRNEGIGRGLMQAAMNAKGGTMYLCCHPERVAFYGHFGFDEVPVESLPEPVLEYFKEVDDYPTPPDHVHHFLKAR